MSTRTLVTVAVVLVVVFAAAVGLGVARGARTGNPGHDGLVDRLSGLAGDTAGVARTDVTTTCAGSTADPDLFRVAGAVPGAACVLTVAPADRLRTLRLQVVDPIHVEAPAPRGDLQVKTDAKAGDDLKIAIGQGSDPTLVLVQCPAVGCRLRLVAP